jgi:hypothetical protein
MIYPVNKIFETQGYGGQHKGVDLRTAHGMSHDILAIANGIIIKTSYDKDGYGYYYDISHDNGCYSRSAHLIKNTLQVGDVVGEGQVITHTTNDPEIWGRSTGEHLHFEIFATQEDYYNKIRTNPLKYINNQNNEVKMLLDKITGQNIKYIQDQLEGKVGYFRSGEKWYMVKDSKIQKEYNSPQEMISDNMCLGLSEEDKNKLI